MSKTRDDLIAEYKALLKQEREQAKREGRQGEMLKDAGFPGALGSVGMGGVHGASHGLSDDIERGLSKRDPRTGKKWAETHARAEAANPILFGLGQVGGTALTGFAIRAGLPALGKARADSIRKSGASNAYGSGSLSSKLEAQAQGAERAIGQLFLKNPKHRATAIDAAHGAAWGAGGVDVHKDEQWDAGRALRTAAGAGLGVLAAPMAAGAGMATTNAPLLWGGRRISKPMLEPPGIQPPNPVGNLVRRMQGKPTVPRNKTGDLNAPISQARGMDEAFARVGDEKSAAQKVQALQEEAARLRAVADHIASQAPKRRSQAWKDRIAEADNDARIAEQLAAEAPTVALRSPGRMTPARRAQPPVYAVAGRTGPPPQPDLMGPPAPYAPAPAMERLADKVFDPRMEGRSPAAFVRGENRDLRAAEMVAMADEAMSGRLVNNQKPHGVTLNRAYLEQLHSSGRAEFDNLMSAVEKGDIGVVNSWSQYVWKLNKQVPGSYSVLQARLLRLMANNERAGRPHLNDTPAMLAFQDVLGVANRGAQSARDRLGVARRRAEEQFPLQRMDAAAERMSGARPAQTLRPRHRAPLYDAMTTYKSPAYQEPLQSRATKPGWDPVLGRPRGDDQAKWYVPWDFFTSKPLSEEAMQAAGLWSGPASYGAELLFKEPISRLSGALGWSSQPASGNPLADALMQGAQPPAASPPADPDQPAQVQATQAPRPMSAMESASERLGAINARPVTPPPAGAADKQRLLTQLGLPPEVGGVDGIEGPATRLALARFAELTGLLGPDDPRVMKYLEGMARQDPDFAPIRQLWEIAKQETGL